MRLVLAFAVLVASSCAHRVIKRECKAEFPEQDETRYKACVHERVAAERAAAPQQQSTFWRDFDDGYQAGRAIVPPPPRSPKTYCKSRRDTLGNVEMVCEERDY